MKALILAAGFGTRMQPLNFHVPKALLPLGKGVVIDAQIKSLLLPPIDTIFILTNNKFYDALMRWRHRASFKKDIHIINNGIDGEHQKRGVIGDLDFFIKTVAPNDDLIVLASDNLFTEPCDDFVNFFYEKKSTVIALHKFTDTNLSDRGNEAMTNPPSGTGRITAFISNPKRPRFPFLASMFYIFPRTLLHVSDVYLRAKQNPDSGGDFIAWLIRNNYSAFGYLMPGKRFDVGDPRAYQSTLDSLFYIS